MASAEQIQDAIKETHVSIEKNMHALENNIQDGIETVENKLKTSLAHILRATELISPLYQAKHHPVAFRGALFWLGYRLARRTAKNHLR